MKTDSEKAKEMFGSVIKLLDAEYDQAHLVTGLKATYCIIREVAIWNKEHEEGKRPYRISVSPCMNVAKIYHGEDGKTIDSKCTSTPIGIEELVGKTQTILCSDSKSGKKLYQDIFVVPEETILEYSVYAKGVMVGSFSSTNLQSAIELYNNQE
jgi:hypothetical protein